RLVAERVIDGLRPTEQELAALRDAFVPHLVRVRLDDGKRVRQLAPLKELPPGSLRLVRALVEARLLSTRGTEKAEASEAVETLVEVTHEALFKAWPRLSQSLTEEQAFLLDLERIRSAHEIWAQAAAGEKPRALLSGLLLSRARDWVSKHPGRFVGSDLKSLSSFIAESASAEAARETTEREQLARIQRFQHRFAIVLGLASILVALGISGSLMFYRQTALRQSVLFANLSQFALLKNF